jgi:tRNA threonylcarbamoyladenosine biosynthesis protein TsaB
VTAARIVLALDAGSPRVAVALARGDELLARASGSHGTERADLLTLVDQTLAAAGLEPAALSAVVALLGPGSFTGARVACATALGLAAATGAAATGVSTFEALALAAPSGSGRLLAVVDALRGDWYVQPFARGSDLDTTPLAEPAIVSPLEARLEGVELLVGFAASRFASECGVALPALDEPEPAAAAARAAALGRWRFDADRLSRPIYLRPPATTRNR